MPAAPTIIFAGGDPGSFSYLRSVDYSDAFLVAVDRGLAVMVELGLIPDLFVGDCDSVAPELVAGLDHAVQGWSACPLRTCPIWRPPLTGGRQRRHGAVLSWGGARGRLDQACSTCCSPATARVDFEGYL